MDKRILALAGVISIAILAAGIWGFFDNQSKLAGTFAANTQINGVDCSFLTEAEAAEALTAAWNSNDFLIAADGEEIKTLTAIDFTYDISASLRMYMTHSAASPLLSWMAKEFEDLHIQMTISTVNKRFIRQVGTVRFVDKKDYVRTKNAYIDMTKTTFPIIPEVYGNNTNKKKLLKDVLSAIEQGRFEMDAEKTDYYAKPSVLSDDPDLVASREMYLNNYAFEIIYDFGYNTQTLTPKEISSMLRRDGGGLVVSEDAVRTYVDQLAQKFDHAGMSRSFYSPSGVKVSVYGGDYGYLIDRAAERAWLTQALKNGESARRSPVYIPTARSKADPSLGTSYVEIDLTAQHLWIYKNGTLVLATPVVTGNVAKGTATPPGTYSVYFMQRDRILRDQDWDGSMYETPVAYWMAFNRGIGLHDAPWRYAFGGTIYKQNGSHGCINMPPKMAEAAYGLLSVGYPVLVHN